MGTKITGKQPYVGFLIPDDRLSTDNLDSTLSTYSQTGPRPGVPTTTSSSSLALVCSGEQTRAVDMITLQSGIPDGSAHIGWRADGDTDSQWRGWNPPNVMEALNSISPSGPDYWTSWDICRATNGDLVALLWGPTGSDGVAIDALVYDRSAATWTETQVVIEYADIPEWEIRWSPALCPLPDGRILAFILRSDNGIDNTDVQIDTWVADVSDLTTWTLLARGVAPNNLAYGVNGIGRARAAYVPAGISLVYEVFSFSDDQWGFRQLASSDIGSRFTRVHDWLDEWDGTATDTNEKHGRHHDLAATSDGRILFVYADNSGTATPGTNLAQVSLLAIGSPYEILYNIPPVKVSTVLPDEVAIVMDEDGLTPFVVYNDHDGTATPNPDRLYISSPSLTDTGALRQWGVLGHGLLAMRDLGGASYSAEIHFGAWYDSNAGTPLLGSGLACAFTGAALHSVGYIAHEHVAGSGTHADRISLIRSGGWFTTPLPTIVVPAAPSAGSFRYRLAYGYYATASHTTIPFRYGVGVGSPAYYGWTTATGGGVDWSGGGTATTFYWVQNDASATCIHSGTMDSGTTVRFDADAGAANVLVADGAAVQIRSANGTDDYDVSIRLKSDEVRVYDNNAGAVIATVSVQGTGRYLAAIRQERFRLWEINPVNGICTLRVETAALVNDNITPGATSAVTWGNIPHTAVGYLCNWKMMAWTANTGPWLIDSLLSQKNPGGDYSTSPPETPITGKPLTSGPNYITDNLYVAGRRGPAGRLEEWSVAPVYDYPVGAILPSVSPSPNQKWRSATDNINMDIAWDLTGTAAVATRMGTTTGILLLGVNFPTALWQGSTDGIAWTTLGTFNTAADFTGIRLSRYYNIIQPDIAAGGAAGVRYVKRNELAGGYVNLGGGNIRPIISNTEGVLKAATTSRRCIIHLDPDSITGAEGGGGTWDIWAPNQLIILAEQQLTGYRYHRLRVSASQTYEDYYAIGQLVAGPIAVFGKAMAYGRTIETVPNYILNTNRNGLRRAQKEGPPRRICQCGWSESDLSCLLTASPEPDYVQIRDTTAPAAGTWEDSAWLMEGILDQSDGAVKPIVFLPSIPSASTTRTTDKDNFVYGRITSTVSRSVVIGEPGVSEVVTLNGVTVEEEV